MRDIRRRSPAWATIRHCREVDRSARSAELGTLLEAAWPISALWEYLDADRANEEVAWATRANEFVKRLSDADLKVLIEALEVSFGAVAGEDVSVI